MDRRSWNRTQSVVVVALAVVSGLGVVGCTGDDDVADGPPSSSAPVATLASSGADAADIHPNDDVAGFCAAYIDLLAELWHDPPAEATGRQRVEAEVERLIAEAPADIAEELAVSGPVLVPNLLSSEQPAAAQMQADVAIDTWVAAECGPAHVIAVDTDPIPTVERPDRVEPGARVLAADADAPSSRVVALHRTPAGAGPALEALRAMPIPELMVAAPTVDVAAAGHDVGRVAYVDLTPGRYVLVCQGCPSTGDEAGDALTMTVLDAWEVP